MSTTTLLDKLKRMYVDPPSEGTCYLHIAPEDQRLMIDLLTKQAAEPVEQAAGQSLYVGTLQRKLSALVDEIERPVEFKPAKEEYFRAGVRAAMIRAIAELEMFAIQQKPEQAVGDGVGLADEFEQVHGHVAHILTDDENDTMESVSKLLRTPRLAVATPAEMTDEMAWEACHVFTGRRHGHSESFMTRMRRFLEWLSNDPDGRRFIVAQPSAVGVPDTYTPTDDDVREWMRRSDVDHGSVEQWRAAIDDARSMHLLAAAPEVK